MAVDLVCWRCGEQLRDDLPRTFPRLEQCRGCGSDLHVCRMCRFFAPQYPSNCSHEQAEPARTVDQANFCPWFTLRPGAHDGPLTAAEQARDRLASLFDGAAADEPAAPVDPDAPDTGPDPLDQLRALFGDGGDDKPG
jgi:hypothetical protein